MKKHDTIATRLVLILNKFNSGERFSIDDLVEEFGVTNRTIQRDLNERLSYLPIKKENKQYYLEEYYLGKLNFNDIENFAILSGIKELYPTLKEDFLKSILDDTISKAYIIKGHNYEDISNHSKEFKTIENSILSFTQLEFIYNNKPRTVNPYKLLNTKGIWYLIAIQKDNIKTFNFKKIEKLKHTHQTFTPQQHILDTISNDDNVWYGSNQIEVKLQVNKEVASYFKRRKIIPNQIIVSNISNLTFSPIANKNSIAYDYFGFKVNDGDDNSTNEYMLTINVTGVNDTPKIDTTFSNITLNEDNGTSNYDLNISDIEGDTLKVTVDSNDSSVLKVTPNWTNNLSRTDYHNVTLDFNLTTVANKHGLVTITIKVQDENGASFIDMFDVNISAVNDMPTLPKLSNRIVYKNFDDINITLASTDIDGDILTYNISALDETIVNLFVTNNIITLKSIEGESGKTDINITVSDNEYNISKTFTLQILSLEDGDNVEEKGDVNQTTNEKGSEFLTITVPDDNLTLKTQKDTNGTIYHEIIVNGKKTSAISDINGSKVEMNENGLHTTFSNTDLDIEVNATITGKAIHTLTVKGKTTKAISEKIGAKTIIHKEANGSIEIVTSVILDNNTSVSVTAKENGQAEHTVQIGNKSSYTKVNVVGGETTIGNTGIVTTLFKTAQSITSTDGTTRVELNGKALLIGAFELGTNIIINTNSAGDEYIEINTPTAESNIQYIVE